MAKSDQRGDETLEVASPLQRALAAAKNRGFTWGPWRYTPRTFELVHDEHDYCVDLRELRSSALVFQRLSQLGMKLWITPADIGHFLLALDVLLCLQANFGSDEPIDPTTVLERHLPAWGEEGA